MRHCFVPRPPVSHIWVLVAFNNQVTHNVNYPVMSYSRTAYVTQDDDHCRISLKS